MHPDVISSVRLNKEEHMVERIAYMPAEACELLRVGLKAVALGGKTLIPRVEIEEFLSELPSIQMRAHRGVRNVAP
jgi:hypothetical protein